MRSPLPFPCVPDRPSKILLAQVDLFIYSRLARTSTTKGTADNGPLWAVEEADIFLRPRPPFPTLPWLKAPHPRGAKEKLLAVPRISARRLKEFVRFYKEFRKPKVSEESRFKHYTRSGAWDEIIHARQP